MKFKSYKSQILVYLMKDPVCGMEVSEKNDFGEYEGRKFQFCCASCRWAFENDPKQFVSEQS